MINLDVSSVADSVVSGLDELFTSDDERNAARLAITKELNKAHLLQAETNKAEASHPSVFVSGWRPALGWLTVVLLGYAWVIRDFVLIGIMALDRPDIAAGLPVVDSSEMLTLVFALLGLGATRTYEKIKGVARSN